MKKKEAQQFTHPPWEKKKGKRQQPHWQLLLIGTMEGNLSGTEEMLSRQSVKHEQRAKSNQPSSFSSPGILMKGKPANVKKRGCGRSNEGRRGGEAASSSPNKLGNVKPDANNPPFLPVIVAQTVLQWVASARLFYLSQSSRSFPDLELSESKRNPTEVVL